MRYILLLSILFNTKIHTKENNIDYLVNILRKESKCNIIISSGYRNKKKNKLVGGSKNSYHLKNLARDLVLKNKCKYNYYTLGKLATKYFKGVIVYNTHIHVDMRPRKFHSCFTGRYLVDLSSKICNNLGKSQKLGLGVNNATYNWIINFRSCSEHRQTLH